MRKRARYWRTSLGRMNLSVTRTRAPMRRHLILGCITLLVLLGLAARAVVALDEAPAAPAHQSSALKAFLEPWFASKDGNDKLQDPEYRQAMRAQWRLSTEAKYFHLALELELSSDQTDRLYDLVVDHIFEDLEAPIQPVTSPEYGARKRKQDRELAELIGEHRLAQLHEYDATFAYRNEVTRLQVHFAVGTDVLRDDQVDAMIAILRDAGQELERTRPTGEDYTGATEEQGRRLQAKTRELRRQHDDRVLEAAANVLTPAQHAALDASFRRDRVHWELQESAHDIVPKGKSGVARDPHAVRSYFLVGTNDDRLVQDPDYRRIWLLEKRLEVESTYVDVPQLLKLSPELTDRFFSLLVEQRLARVENPTNTTSGAEDRLRQEDRELRMLLGEANCARFFEFQDSYTQRHQVKHLRIAIGAGGDSLREDQVEKLISIVRDADAEMQRAKSFASGFIFFTKAGRERQTAKNRELRRQYDARIRAAAAPLLTPRQFAVLDSWVRWGLDP
jgi:hypothetical protein